MPSAESLILSANPIIMRDPVQYLDEIWHHYFADVPRVNTVEIAYSRPWKNRLGLIRLSLDQTTSFIGLNQLLQLSQVPDFILITTIAHELAHYTHGFGSPLPRLYEHPHANNVVKHELERRGLGKTMRLCDEWIDKQWFSFYDRERGTDWVDISGTYHLKRRQRKSHSLKSSV